MSALGMLALAVLLAAPAAGQPKEVGKRAPRTKINRTAKKGVAERPVKITSDAWEMLPGDRQATWKGHVVVVRDDMRVSCAALVADYDEAKQLKRLTCTGNAHMRQAPNPKLKRAEREAWGQVAVFDNETGVLTVTGSPRARDGQNTMEGERILFDTEADKVRVERPVMTLHTPPAAPRAKEPRK